MMVDRESREIDGEACPKRAWVMSMLSGDEALDSEGHLPPGVRFHLSRCPSCGVLADSITAVTDTLGSLTDQMPPGDLGDRANLQLAQALRHGARLTGRVEIADQPPTPPTMAMPRRLSR